MSWMLITLALFPVVALWRARGRGWSGTELVRVLLLFATGLFVASPFLTDCAIGTGEAYNYSQAAGDTIAQMRAGTFPVFVGQSEFAFNGRIHPLRTAVYYTHAAGLLDFATFHRLPFWQVQNLSLAVSLMAAAFSAYACLRRIAELSPWLACLLGCWYTLTPGLLAAAHGIELYMTVTAAPFLPWAVLGALRGAAQPSPGNYAMMAIGLAGAWLAHPPVAAWTCLTCGVVLLAGWLSQRPRLAPLYALSGAAVLGLVLSGWAFASVLTLPPDISSTPNTAASRQEFARLILERTLDVGYRAFLPVRHAGKQLGDFQLGYAGWVLLGFVVLAAWRGRRVVPWATVGAMLLIVVLTLPIPGLHRGLWSVLPAAFSSMSNIWPMQRSYLVLSAFVLVSFALAWPGLHGKFSRGGRIVALLAVLGLAAWTVREAGKFVRGGLGERHTPENTASIYRSSNMPTPMVSYALMGLPANFHAGPQDPRFALRLVSHRGGTRVLADNLADGGAPQVRASGVLTIADASQDDFWPLAPTLSLEPQRHYRLKLDFLVPPFAGLINFAGPGLSRFLELEDRLSPTGFGMKAEQAHQLPLWSDGSATEEVKLNLLPREKRIPGFTDFARFQLEEIDPAQLPIRLLSLVPSLRCRVDAPEAGWLQTPRMLVPGYEARVDGRPAYPRRAADGQTMIPVPAGSHDVELSYRPPSILRWASTVTVAGWGLLAVGLLAAPALSPRLRDRTRNASARTVDYFGPAHWKTHLFVGLAVLAGAGIAWRSRQHLSRPAGNPGPLQLRVLLPLDGLGRSEPLFCAGRGKGSTTVYLRHLDSETVQLGVDVWGDRPYESDPFELDFSQPVDLTISTSAMYPADAFRAQDAGAEQIAWLQGSTRVWLNGRKMLDVPTRLDPANARNYAIGKTTTGSDSHQPVMTGRILEQRWLSLSAAQVPIPSPTQLRTEAGPLKLQLRLPAKEIGQAEPLLTFGEADAKICLFAHYLDDTHLRLGVEGPGAPLQFTEALAVNYTEPVDVTVSESSLYPADHSLLADYSPMQADRLRQLLRVKFQGRDVLALAPKKIATDPQAIRFGSNAEVSRYAGKQFTGQILAVSRATRDQWPVPPGRPEAATAADAVGPLELKITLPADQAGHTQPLLATGKAGAGLIVMIQYLDAQHVRLGADVWGKALFWSQPVEVDLTKPHLVTIAATALFPADHPAVKDQPWAERRRNELVVTWNGAAIIRENISSYDSTHGEITPGKNELGGSYAEARFLGDILSIRRLPPASD